MNITQKLEMFDIGFLDCSDNFEQTTARLNVKFLYILKEEEPTNVNCFSFHI